MIIDFTYEKEFDEFMESLKGNKAYNDLATLDGIGKQTDMNAFSKKFFGKADQAAADVSVDSNANVDDISIIAYEAEVPKPLFRLNAYYLLWKYGKKLFGVDEAERLCAGQFFKDYYINDFHKFATTPYCFNFSCLDVVFSGLPFVNKITSLPPRHLNSFVNQMIQFVTYASNSVAGAVGLADLLICMSYFYDREISIGAITDADVKQQIQSFIFSVNQPFRGGHQSAFTNVSLFDDNFLKKMCGEYRFPDGSQPNPESVKKLQVMYMDVMNETLEKTPCTFPVTTACFSVDDNRDILDKDFLRLVAEKNLKFGWINYYSGSTSTLSSCCFTGDTKILTADSNGAFYGTFKELYDSPWEERRKNLTVFHNGSWQGARIIKVPRDGKKIYQITLANGKSIKATEDHIHQTLRGDVKTSDLTINDSLAFNMLLSPEKNRDKNNLTYNEGFIVGLYAGDGSKYKRKDCESYSVTFSLNNTTKKDLTDTIDIIMWDKFGVQTHINENDKLLSVSVYSKDVYDWIGKYVGGNHAEEKYFTNACFTESIEFRQGIIDGWQASDGSNSNRIYSVSNRLMETGEALFTTLGIPTRIDSIDRTGEVEIKGETFTRNYPSLCLRWYNPQGKRSMGDVYIVRNNTMYFYITEIKEIDVDDTEVYCFEMDNQSDPYFTLPNGIMTHNCRLRSEADHEYFNTFGAGGTKIGSLSVTTINLPRIAYDVLHESTMYGGVPEDLFINELKDRVKMCAEINAIKRHVIKKRIKNNNLPLYTLGFMDLKKQYSTCGLNGINEAVEIMGMDILSKEGQDFVEKILEVVNAVNKEQEKRFGYPHNCEQTPSENSAIKLAQADMILGYNDKYEFYSNQFIPLTVQTDLLNRILLQGKFDHLMTGGAIMHINVAEQIKDPQDIVDLISSSAKQGVIYQAINYVINVCENGHVSVGRDSEACPICGKQIRDRLTRVVGFLTNIKNWHLKRREHDFPERKFYKGV